MTYKVTVNGRSKTVELESYTADSINFVIDGKKFQVSVTKEKRETAVSRAVSFQNPVGKSPAPSVPMTNGSISAPMPGLLVSVLVKEGDQVKPGQNLLVIEAMKMENNISATCSGIVEKILVKAGQEIQNGQELVKFSNK